MNPLCFRTIRVDFPLAAGMNVPIVRRQIHTQRGGFVDKSSENVMGCKPNEIAILSVETLANGGPDTCNDFTPNLGSTGDRMFERFQGQSASTFAKHRPIAVRIKRPRHFGWIGTILC